MGAATPSEQEPLLGIKKETSPASTTNQSSQRKFDSLQKAVIALSLLLVGYLSFTQLTNSSNDFKV
jgi:hypothetical protein